ncbi:MAG: hypothetical protein WAQ25_02020 [Candidatus Saccharimonas sp.]
MSEQLEMNSTASCITYIDDKAILALSYKEKQGWTARINGVSVTRIERDNRVTQVEGHGPTAEAAIYHLWALLWSLDRNVLICVGQGNHGERYVRWNSVEARWDDVNRPLLS